MVDFFDGEYWFEVFQLFTQTVVKMLLEPCRHFSLLAHVSQFRSFCPNFGTSILGDGDVHLPLYRAASHLLQRRLHDVCEGRIDLRKECIHVWESIIKEATDSDDLGSLDSASSHTTYFSFIFDRTFPIWKVSQNIACSHERKARLTLLTWRLGSSYVWKRLGEETWCSQTVLPFCSKCFSDTWQRRKVSRTY